MQTPRHIAIIMDGNGRWAHARGLPRLQGHREGAESVRAIVRECRRRGVEALTLYSFSTENWRRPQDEVDGLMALLGHYLDTEVNELQEQGIRLRAIGELSDLPENIQLLLAAAQFATAGNSDLTLTLALSYGSRAEIRHAVQSLATQVQNGEIKPEDIDDGAISKALYTSELPDPDLLIRTSGEMRLSNFLLWQLAYSELHITDVAWPDFREPHLDRALQEYGSRQRRFGKTGAQVESEREEGP